MNKFIQIITILILLLTIISISKTNISLIDSNKIKLNISSFTKAVCKENYCQDYLFECENKKIKSINPITGAAIQFDNNWKDPRTPEQINKVC